MSKDPVSLGTEPDLRIYKLKQRHFDAVCRRDQHRQAMLKAQADINQIERELGYGNDD